MRRQTQQWAQVVFMSHARPALTQATLVSDVLPRQRSCSEYLAWWAVQGSNL
ncbi:MAG TPA: hypothetical protein PLN74_08010 [Thermomonas sp.]|nr:hypothetical protein [Thermomonas sp.]